MSKAFTKEEVDPPERSGRTRSASGLPPGAVNYITAQGEQRLREELLLLTRREDRDAARQAELEEILREVTVVDPPEEPGNEIAFGARVTVRDAVGQLHTYHIVGVNELAFSPDAVSWISPTGRALLAAASGDRVTLDEVGLARIVQVEYDRA